MIEWLLLKTVAVLLEEGVGGNVEEALESTEGIERDLRKGAFPLLEPISSRWQ